MGVIIISSIGYNKTLPAPARSSCLEKQLPLLKKLAQQTFRAGLHIFDQFLLISDGRGYDGPVKEKYDAVVHLKAFHELIG
jgi:hypothetical protein